MPQNDQRPACDRPPAHSTLKTYLAKDSIQQAQDCRKPCDGDRLARLRIELSRAIRSGLHAEVQILLHEAGPDGASLLDELQDVGTVLPSFEVNR